MSTNESNATYIGVFESFLAKNAGVKTFISMKNGKPIENAIKLNDDCWTSYDENSPLRKIVLIKSTEHKYKPIKDGNPMNKTNL